MQGGCEHAAKFAVPEPELASPRTRADYFADPVALERFFDSIERELLGKNGFFNWLRAVFFPTPRD